MADYKEPSSPVYFEDLFQKYGFGWSKIYLLPRLLPADTAVHAFLYKGLHNAISLNQKLFLWHKVTSAPWYSL